jgi:transcriptional regulator with XRE-family HTH domain
MANIKTLDPESAGARIRGARETVGKTQADVAALLGVSMPFISDLERGRRKASLEWLRDYADALGVPRSSLSADLADRKPKARKKKPPVDRP